MPIAIITYTDGTEFSQSFEDRKAAIAFAREELRWENTVAAKVDGEEISDD